MPSSEAPLALPALDDSPEPARELWRAVHALVDAARSLDDLREHRLELLAARRWRRTGRDVPPELAFEERHALLRTLSVVPLLGRVREIVDGPILVLKGPEVAALYPGGTTRPFIDVDLLLPDAVSAQRALLEHGFEEIGDPARYRDIHHLRPLFAPAFALALELHTAPKWLEGVRPPTFESLLERAVPSATGVAGLLAPSRPDHAVLVAVHSWAHEPFRRLGELVDVAALSWRVPREELAGVAAELGVERLWRATTAGFESVLAGRRATIPLRTWSRNVAQVRRRTVFETHLARLLAPFSILPPLRAACVAARMLPQEFVPQTDEPWRRKLRRARRSIINARRARGVHDTQLEERDLL
jgi:Uncharacterised nucleotidyltransferase